MRELYSKAQQVGDALYKILVNFKKPQKNKYPQKWNPKQSKQTKTKHMLFIHHQATLKPVPIIDSEEGDWLPELDSTKNWTLLHLKLMTA